MQPFYFYSLAVVYIHKRLARFQSFSRWLLSSMRSDAPRRRCQGASFCVWATHKKRGSQRQERNPLTIKVELGSGLSMTKPSPLECVGTIDRSVRRRGFSMRPSWQPQKNNRFHRRPIQLTKTWLTVARKISSVAQHLHKRSAHYAVGGGVLYTLGLCARPLLHYVNPAPLGEKVIIEASSITTSSAL